MADEPEAEDEAGTRRSRDPELLAIERAVRIIDELEHPAPQQRAIAYLVSRYLPAIYTAKVEINER